MSPYLPSADIKRTLRRWRPPLLIGGLILDIYAVIANGYGATPDYGDELSVNDRWAVVAYVCALELSRHAAMADVPAAQRTALENSR